MYVWLWSEWGGCLGNPSGIFHEARGECVGPEMSDMPCRLFIYICSALLDTMLLSSSTALLLPEQLGYTKKPVRANALLGEICFHTHITQKTEIRLKPEHRHYKIKWEW